MIYFHVEMQDLTEIEAALGMMKDKSKMVLKAAINNAAKETEKRMTNEAKKKYRFESGRVADIRAANDIEKAKGKNLSATIEVKSRIKEPKNFVLITDTYFPGSVGAPKVLKAKNLRNGKLHKLALKPNASGDQYKAFVVKYHNSGGKDHIALAQRVPGSRMKAKNKEKIQTLYAPSITKMEEVVYMDEVHEDMHDILMNSIEKQMQRLLK